MEREGPPVAGVALWILATFALLFAGVVLSFGFGHPLGLFGLLGAGMMVGWFVQKWGMVD